MHWVETLKGELGPLFHCDMLDTALRVTTPFMDDSNDLIDVYVTMLDDGYALSDFGESLAYLRLSGIEDHEVDHDEVKRVAAGSGVEIEGSEMVMTSDGSDLAVSVLCVAIAAMRVTHMRFRL